VAAVIPALNERSSLPTVVAELRASWPELRIIVVDDGSADDTFEAALGLGCEALRLPISLGVGSAVRAGIRYARRLGHDTIVRLDADGQHAPADLPRMLAPILNGAADAVVGTRRTSEAGQWARRAGRGALALALVPFLRHRVDDPTSGFWAFGPRAVALLATRHPTGYPEPELHLLLAGAGLTTAQVPIATRTRVAGRTTLTARRAGLAFARALLAMIVVPLRPSGDPPQ
jgi:glycosyltransferase involved in cell wall biosynthesis